MMRLRVLQFSSLSLKTKNNWNSAQCSLIRARKKSHVSPFLSLSVTLTMILARRCANKVKTLTIPWWCLIIFLTCERVHLWSNKSKWKSFSQWRRRRSTTSSTMMKSGIILLLNLPSISPKHKITITSRTTSTNRYHWSVSIPKKSISDL